MRNRSAANRRAGLGRNFKDREIENDVIETVEVGRRLPFPESELNKRRSVASIQKDLFERLIEPDNSPTITRLVIVSKGHNSVRCWAKCCLDCEGQL